MQNIGEMPVHARVTDKIFCFIVYHGPVIIFISKWIIIINVNDIKIKGGVSKPINRSDL